MAQVARVLENREEKADRNARSFLTFLLGSEQYGVEILKVQEIIGLLPITRVPNARSHIKGLVNLRGKILMVIDLRLRFGMEDVEPTEESCIIFVRVQQIEMGLIVDKVSDVLDIPEDDIDKDQTFSTDCLLGIGKVDGKARLLLDLDKVCEVGA
ncbi:MAG: chemotaxis protein CheW [Acidobacteriota bacterium]|jgi:purine-binding chemotaxis protein CheW